MSSIDVLNQLLVLHSRSLAVYLRDASPWVSPADAAATEALDALIDNNIDFADRFGELIMAEGGNPANGEFPMEYTGYNDCALSFLLPKVKAEQENTVRWIEQFVASLDDDPMAKAFAQEALGAAKAHRDALNEFS